MVRHRDLDVMPHHRWSFIARVGGRQSFEFQTITWEVFPISYQPEDLPGQVEFALKYDGVNLEVLRGWFEALAVDEVEALEAWVREAPTSGYARRTWFLYEFLTGRALALEDARTGAYVRLLDPDRYYVADDRRSRRHHVLDNLFGGREFCALVRRSAMLESFTARRLDQRMQDVLAHQDPETLARVVSYLYTKETRSSFAIEQEQPSTDKVKRFVSVLRQAHEWPALGREDLLRLQNLIVTDPRNRDTEYRRTQNYVARASDIDYIAPRPEDLTPMMAGWLEMLGRLVESPCDAVVAAASAAFSFVFLHPFEDGNGRIHRYLIHFVLARKRFTPTGMLVPVSATMLAKKKEYDAALERFSEALMVRLRYEVDRMGIVEVLHDSSAYYRYPDLTSQAEALYGWIASTIEEDVPRELTFTLAYREARRRVSDVIELADRRAEHFVARCMENRGHLSNNRRKGDFASLTDEEIAVMEAAVQVAMRAHGMETDP